MMIFFEKQKQNKTKNGKYTRRKVNKGAKTLGGITKVIKSYEGISSVKYHLKGGVSHILPC